MTRKIEIEDGFWRNLGIAGLVLLIIFIFYNVSDSEEIITSKPLTDFYLSCETGYTKCNGECLSCVEGYYLATDCHCHPLASTQWGKYSTTLNNDIAKINQIKNKYSNMETTEDINNYVAEIDPRYQIYSTHLIEARNFLNNYGNQLDNEIELKRDVDEHIVELDTEINQFNLAVNRYNEQMQIQQNQQIVQQEAIETFVKVLAMAI